MALVPKELVTRTSRGPLPRIQPAPGPGATITVPISVAGTAGTIQKAGQAMRLAATTGIATAVADAGVGVQIDGILMHDVENTGSGEEVAVLMIKGEIHWTDLKNGTMDAPDGEGLSAISEANLLTLAHSKALLDRGIVVSGLNALGSTTTA